jgi:hypothetical protein
MTSYRRSAGRLSAHHWFFPRIASIPFISRGIVSLPIDSTLRWS